MSPAALVMPVMSAIAQGPPPRRTGSPRHRRQVGKGLLADRRTGCLVSPACLQRSTPHRRTCRPRYAACLQRSTPTDATNTGRERTGERRRGWRSYWPTARADRLPSPPPLETRKSQRLAKFRVAGDDSWQRSGTARMGLSITREWVCLSPSPCSAIAHEKSYKQPQSGLSSPYRLACSWPRYRNGGESATSHAMRFCPRFPFPHSCTVNFLSCLRAGPNLWTPTTARCWHVTAALAAHDGGSHAPRADDEEVALRALLDQVR